MPGYNPKPFFRLIHPFLTRLWRRVTRSAAAIVSPSRTLAALIESVGPGVPVQVIANGIDENRFRPAVKRDEILVATRLVERKGVQYLLQALAGSGIECRFPDVRSDAARAILASSAARASCAHRSAVQVRDVSASSVPAPA